MESLQSEIVIAIFFRKLLNIILKFSTVGFLISKFSSFTFNEEADFNSVRPTYFDVKLKLSLEELLLPVLLTGPPENHGNRKHYLTF